MDIGEPQRIIHVEPIQLPDPVRIPDNTPVVVPAEPQPAKEPVPVP